MFVSDHMISGLRAGYDRLRRLVRHRQLIRSLHRFDRQARQIAGFSRARGLSVDDAAQVYQRVLDGLVMIHQLGSIPMSPSGGWPTIDAYAKGIAGFVRSRGLSVEDALEIYKRVLDSLR